MFTFDRHERLRRELSAYADGELSQHASAKVESHLATCEDCRALVDSLRVTSAALSGLPAAETPRSFALTPEMLGDEAPAPSARPAPSYVNGLRLAAAGLAVALAVVLIADQGDFGGGSDSQESSVQEVAGRLSTTTEANADRARDADAPPAVAPAESQYAQGAEPTARAQLPQATGVPAGAAPEPLDNGVTGESAAPEVPAGGTDDKTASESSSQPEAASEDAAETAASDDAEAITVVEAVLGILLAASLVGLVLTWISQRRHAA